jgi:alpha-beta hydrolase superfamily lysophospholipase
MTSTDTAQLRVHGTPAVATTAGDGEEAILCVHGLASQRALLTPLVERLAEAGYRALAPDLRGHGDSAGTRGLLSRDRVLADLRAWHRWLEDEGTQLRAIVGHSLGGLWALVAREQLPVDALAMVATPASIRRETAWIERAIYRVGYRLQRLVDPLGLTLRAPNRVGLDDVLETEEAIESARRLDLVQASIPLANARALLALDGPTMAADTEIPAVVARPTRDRLVPEASTRSLYEALAGPRTWLEIDGPHECFFDATGDTCASALVDALEDALPEPGDEEPDPKEP